MRFRLTVLSVLMVACSDAGTAPVQTPPPPSPKSVVQATSETSLSGTVLTAVDPTPSVVVKDENGKPLPGVSVKFFIASGGGSVSPLEAVTDADGTVRVSKWVLGPVATSQPASGRTPNVLWAYTIGLESRAVFTATAQPGPPARILASTQVPPGDTLVGGWPVAIYARVSDAIGNFIPHSPVSFTVRTGAGSVTPVNTETDEFGRLTAQWILGTPGLNTMQVAAGDLSPVSLGMFALDPARFTWYDLELPAGCPGSSPILAGMIGLAPDGRLAVNTDYQGGGHSSALGQYTVNGSSISLDTYGFVELGSFDSSHLVLDRSSCDDGVNIDVWTYRKRAGSAP